MATRLSTGGTVTRQTRRDDAAARAAAEKAEAERVEAERQARITRESDPRPTSSSLDVFGGGFLNPGKAAQDKYDAAEATDERYGNEFSWLDPTFQQEAELAKYDPAAAAQQSAAMDRAHALANENLNFSDPALQQALGSEWARIQGGAGAPTFAGDADQRRVLEQALGFSSNQGPGSLTFDDGSRQREQYGNLQGIIAGGGATAIEMADRARGRADSESWLRGQREADMANYAERGLTGSGMELLNLSADRQGAAQRNSLADLETAKALEERRLGAINDAGGLATNMRGQTIDEQALLNQRTTTGLGSAASVANAMRGADFDEKQYLDKRTIDALAARTDLQTKMRDQQYNEQIGQRDAQQSALDTWANTAGDARKQGASEAEYQADQINKVNDSNKTFLRDAYDATQKRKQDRYLEELRLKTGAAEGLMGSDQKDNITGSGQGSDVGAADTKAINDAVTAYREGRISAEDLSGILSANKAKNTNNPNTGEIIGSSIDLVGQVFGGPVGKSVTGQDDVEDPFDGALEGEDRFDDERFDNPIGGNMSALTAKGVTKPATTPPLGTTAGAATTTQSPWRQRRKAAAGTAGAAYDPERLRKAMGY